MKEMIIEKNAAGIYKNLSINNDVDWYIFEKSFWEKWRELWVIVSSVVKKWKELFSREDLERL